MRIPSVIMSWNPLLSMPRIRPGAISDRYTGTLWLANPTPTPSSTRPRISIATFTAAPLSAHPTRKVTPPANMDHLRPAARVTDAAKSDAISAAT